MSLPIRYESFLLLMWFYCCFSGEFNILAFPTLVSPCCNVEITLLPSEDLLLMVKEAMKYATKSCFSLRLLASIS